MSDQDSELYPHFSSRIDIPEIETESRLSKTNWKIMESFNIYKNTQLKKAKYANKHFLEIFNTQLKFKVPKWIKKEWVTYLIAQKIN